MSLFEEARRGIRNQQIEAEETRRKNEESRRLMAEEVENNLRVRLQCIKLLRQYGTSDLESPLAKVKAFFWDNGDVQRKELVELKTTIEKSGEVSVEVTIMSESLVPEKGDITVRIQGMPTYLELPITGRALLVGFPLGLANERYRHSKPASREDLKQYQDVLSVVKGKLSSLPQRHGRTHR